MDLSACWSTIPPVPLDLPGGGQREGGGGLGGGARHQRRSSEVRLSGAMVVGSDGSWQQHIQRSFLQYSVKCETAPSRWNIYPGYYVPG